VIKCFPVRNDFSGNAPLITRREAAELSRVTLGAVNKAIEQKVLQTQRSKGRTVLMVEDVAALRLLAQTRVSLPVAVKKRIAVWARSGPAKNAELRLDEALVVRIGPEVEDAVQRARRYVELREQLVEVDPDVCGGEPVIKNSRVTIRGLARQIEGGETLEVLREDFDFIPEEAFELAPVWAKGNPRQGRPSRPWATGERTRVRRRSTHVRAA
jgi:uncharacterized protein (DUF433 family)